MSTRKECVNFLSETERVFSLVVCLFVSPTVCPLHPFVRQCHSSVLVTYLNLKGENLEKNIQKTIQSRPHWGTQINPNCLNKKSFNTIQNVCFKPSLIQMEKKLFEIKLSRICNNLCHQLHGRNQHFTRYPLGMLLRKSPGKEKRKCDIVDYFPSIILKYISQR